MPGRMDRNSRSRENSVKCMLSDIHLLVTVVVIVALWPSAGHAYSVNPASSRNGLTVLDVSGYDDNEDRKKFVYVPVPSKSVTEKNGVTPFVSPVTKRLTNRYRSLADQKMMDHVMSNVHKKGMDSRRLKAGELVQLFRMVAQKHGSSSRGRMKGMRFGVSRKRSQDSVLESLMSRDYDAERDESVDEDVVDEEEAERLAQLLGRALQDGDDDLEQLIEKTITNEINH